MDIFKFLKKKSKLEILSILINIFFFITLFFFFNNALYLKIFTVLWIVTSFALLITLGIKEVFLKKNKVGYVYFIIIVIFILFIISKWDSFPK